jgi:trehalose-6-phosphate synthase
VKTRLIYREDLQAKHPSDQPLISSANRRPVTFDLNEDGNRISCRGSGELNATLFNLTQKVDATWISCARTCEEGQWCERKVPLSDQGKFIQEL